MRIQHNIMAMNAYRNYSTNTSALSKNLEKLSSGYKINRAGDDAAGLAISEKMRAQITGLETAQKNAKDGISLVQTAEGALTEVHDMLNRMVELANQSANGTYDNDTDRANLQKEVDQLLEEIDRIADSANFNGINLLDGTMSSGTVKASYNALSAADIKGLLLPEAAASTAGVAGTNTMLETNADAGQLPSFSVELDGLSHVVKSATTDTFTLTIGGQTASTAADAFNTAGYKNGDKLEASDLAELLDGKQVTLDGIAYTAKANGSKLEFTADAVPDKSINAHYDVSFTGVKGSTVAATPGVYTTGTYTQGGAATSDAAMEVTVQLADGTSLSFKAASLAQSATIGTVVTALKAATATAAGKTYKLSDYFAVATAGGAFTFTSVEKGANTAKVTNVAYTKGANGTGTLAAAAPNAWVAGADAYDNGTSGSINVGSVNIVVNDLVTPNQLANTVLDLSGKLTDGSKITLGDQTYTIAVGDDSAFANVSGAVKVDANATEEEIASALTQAAKDNTTFSVGHVANTGKISLQQLQSAKDSTDMTTMDKLASYIGVSTVDTTKGEPIVGKGLTLQIGDTSDDFNQLTVDIQDMHANSLGIAGLNISTQDGAQAAVDTIKNAINTVSSVRGTLGATQNRLDHTINNLSVMTENIQDAESTIRDTDVADEMMAYTKNNILVQSAQAMLAQANQVPQGVLQLLQ